MVINYDLLGPLEILQAIGKTLSTGLMGLAFLFIYWKTHDIWVCAILHALFDFIPFLPIALFGIPEQLGGLKYVQSGVSGIAALMAYIIHIGINIYVVSKMYYNFVQDIDFDKLRKEW